MPDELVVVYDSEGNPAHMHSVDATEAVALGDYTYAPPGTAVPPESMAASLARMRGMSVAPHPELQTPEQREATRREANEAAAAAAEAAGQPVPVPVAQALGAKPAPSAATASAAEPSAARSHTRSESRS